jgi:glycosyltransferase involved in cell wall biosynthesis
MPLSWLEVMACGKPVVVYDIGWAREVVEHRSTGLLAKAGEIDGLAEAMLSLLRDPVAGRRLGVRARRQVEAIFSVRAMASASIEWYERILRESECRKPDTRSH